MGPMRIGPGTELGLQAASRDIAVPWRRHASIGVETPHRLSTTPSVFVFPPNRACGARVADRAGLVHGPERERTLDTGEQAVDLDAR